jgi:hypothetical protein
MAQIAAGDAVLMLKVSNNRIYIQPPQSQSHGWCAGTGLFAFE